MLSGPTYAMRNLVYRTGTGVNSFEGGGNPFNFIYGTPSDGAVYLFHNTSDAVLADNDGMMVGGEPGMWDRIVSRNNVWSGTRYALANYTEGQSLDFDYDNLFTSATDKFALIKGEPDPDYGLESRFPCVEVP